MRLPDRGGSRRQPRRVEGSVAATEDAARLSAAARDRVDAAAGVGWYEPGNASDRAALTLCRLRRAHAGAQGGTEHGDAAVRQALSQADPDALVWIASRAISYMDESGFPHAVELWFPDDDLRP